ncbi:MAG: D-alanine--D-alanine ligase [Candidatus Saccharimonadales bacterium]
MSNVIVLAGGDSEERAVSLRSGNAVAEALRERHHQVEIVDPAEGLSKYIDKFQAADVVFSALHGADGEDGVTQRFLEEYDIRYVGSDSKASALCFDKARYTALLREHDILVPETALVDAAEYQTSALASRPHVLKPNTGGSSIDTFIVRDLNKVDGTAIEHAFDKHHTMLLQKLIAGVELTVAVLDTAALPVIEIIPPADKEFDYENKYNGATQELCPPVDVDKAIQEQSQALAMQIHTLTGCRDMSRTDIMATESGTLYVLETNTIPGLTDQSLLPKAAAAAGYTMDALCDHLIQLALNRDT